MYEQLLGFGPGNLRPSSGFYLDAARLVSEMTGFEGRKKI